LTFQDAWQRFGGSGPLLEFVFLITQSELLRERLKQQVENLRDLYNKQLIHPQSIEVLRIIALASAYEAEVDIAKLGIHLHLPELDSILDTFEKEYLFTRSEDGYYVVGLHPIRSIILMELLLRPPLHNWKDIASDCLILIPEEELGSFLSNAFADRWDLSAGLIEKLLTFQPHSWRGIGGILRAFLWFGLRSYLQKNQPLIEELQREYGEAWYMVLHSDVALTMTDFPKSIWETVGSPELRNHLKTYQRRQTPIENIYTYLEHWLNNINVVPPNPTSPDEWKDLAQVYFWIGHRRIQASPLRHWLETLELEPLLDSLSLDIVGDIVFAFSAVWPDTAEWQLKHYAQVMARFRKETLTVKVEEVDSVIRSHFIVNIDDIESQQGDQGAQADPEYLGRIAVQRVTLMRKLFPYHPGYGCQGYGHKLAPLQAQAIDQTTKTAVDRARIHSIWATELNSTFRLLGNFALRPENWDAYAKNIFKIRELIVATLESLSASISYYLEHQAPIHIIQHIGTQQWIICLSTLSSPPLLPKTAVDKLGFNGEDKTIPYTEISAMPLGMQPYQRFWKTTQSFFRFLHTFYNLAIKLGESYKMLPKAGSKEKRDTRRRQVVQDRNDFRSIYSLTEAVKLLPDFQSLFRDYFHRYFSEADLESLKQRENQAFDQIWYLWHQFAFTPSRIVQNARKAVLTKARSTKQGFLSKIDHELSALKTKEIYAHIVNRGIKWKGQDVLWIIYDMRKPLLLIEGFEEVYRALKRALSGIAISSLENYLLSVYWPEIIIVPLVNSKTFFELAFVSHSAGIVLNIIDSREEYGWYPLPLPRETVTLLGVQKWENTSLEGWRQFQTVVAEFAIITAHFAGLAAIGTTDEFGLEIVQNYLNEKFSKVSSAYQKVDNAWTLLFNEVQRLIETTFSPHQALLDMRAYMLRIADNIRPPENTEISKTIQIGEMLAWAKRVSEATTHSIVLLLLWAAYLT